MSLDLAPDERPLTTPEALLDTFRRAEKPADKHVIGLEHEKFVYPQGGTTPVPYEGERGIAALLAALEPRGYRAFREAPGAPVIALQHDSATISLEPGGQFELRSEERRVG